MLLTVTQINVTAFNTASPATIPHLSNTATWRFKWRSGGIRGEQHRKKKVEIILLAIILTLINSVEIGANTYLQIQRPNYSVTKRKRLRKEDNDRALTTIALM